MAANISSDSVFRPEYQSVDALASALLHAWSGETSTLWSQENPARGQCSVTALVVYDLFGGLIVKTRLFEGMHFYNMIDGRRVDLTVSQFTVAPDYRDLPSTREEAFGDCTQRQYHMLRKGLHLR